MTEMTRKLRPYWQSVPDIFKYQILSKAVMALWIALLGGITHALLESSGRVAVTSGDFKFLVTSWQGILILLIGIISLFVCVSVDLNSKLILSRHLLEGERAAIVECVKEGFASMQRLFSLRGIGVVIYVGLIAPLVGGLSISSTQSLYIPHFIIDVIKSTPLYRIGVALVLLLFLAIGVANLFILHGIILDRMTAKEASQQSRRLIRGNLRDYLKQNLLFVLVLLVLLLLVTAVFLLIPLALIEVLPLSAGVERVLLLIFIMAGVVLSIGVDLLITPVYIMKMTQVYESYKRNQPVFFTERPKRTHPHAIAEILLAALIVFAGVFFIDSHFDTLFPQESDVHIIAHRAGGIEGPENTLAGFEAGYQAGAWGSETDIQRTKDGYYILNHDNDFKRVAGDERKPSEMTLEEVKTLKVDGEPVPTLEETLEYCRGKMVLFLELKGKTADRQMADDVVRIVKEAGMEKECVLISLKYDLMDYVERTYPGMQTGFLLFASYGDTALLNCDCLALEEESATAASIDSIHKLDKKVLVWTANKKRSQKMIFCSDADGMITDNVAQASQIKEGLAQRTDFERIVDRIGSLL